MPEKDLSLATHKKVMIYTAQGTGNQASYEEYMKAIEVALKEQVEEKIKEVNKMNQNFDESTQKNKPCALDGSIRDAVTYLQFSKLQNSKSHDTITTLSHTMKISNYLQSKGIKKDINNEIKYYDGSYFDTRKQNSQCEIDWFYSGHGQPGYIQLSKNEYYSYQNLINDIVSGIDKHTGTLYKEKDLSGNSFKHQGVTMQGGIGYFINLYLDACHSGSALLHGVKWVNK